MKVFIVDDSSVARSMLIRIITQIKSVEVVGEAGSAQAAIIMLDELKPDVILLEANVAGGMDIINIIKELKSVNPDIFIVLCTDSSSSSFVIPASEYGVDSFINKPYERAKILYELDKVKDRLGL